MGRQQLFNWLASKKTAEQRGSDICAHCNTYFLCNGEYPCVLTPEKTCKKKQIWENSQTSKAVAA